MTTFSDGGVSSIGGGSPQAQEFAKSMCTKLCAAYAIEGHAAEVASPRPSGRTR